MTLTFGIIGAAVLIGAVFLAIHFSQSAKAKPSDEVMRVTRKNRGRKDPLVD